MLPIYIFHFCRVPFNLQEFLVRSKAKGGWMKNYAEILVYLCICVLQSVEFVPFHSLTHAFPSLRHVVYVCIVCVCVIISNSKIVNGLCVQQQCIVHTLGLCNARTGLFFSFSQPQTFLQVCRCNVHIVAATTTHTS